MDALPRLAQAAATRIAAGALNGHHVDSLAHDLGVSGRQLRRAVKRELGVTPVQLAQTHRLLLAKHLLTDTTMTLARVAFASGFQSLRRFNALFRERYRLNPAALRRRRVPWNGQSAAARGEDRDIIRLRLAYRPPFAWGPLLKALQARAIPGVELVDSKSYTRTVQIDGHTGLISVEPLRPSPAGNGEAGPANALLVEISASLLPVLMKLLPRIRALLDVDAEPEKIDAHLKTAGLSRLVNSCPGLRVPGAFDGFETALRTLIEHRVGDLVATERMGNITSAFGQPIETGKASLDRLAPSAERLADAGVEALVAIGLPQEHATQLQALAQLIAERTLRLDRDTDHTEATRLLMTIPNIDRITAELVAMKATSWPDAFPPANAVMRRVAGGMSAEALHDVAERWRPWRAYAAMHLWQRVPASRTA